MNVWSQSKRSWRKAQKRAVSPIIATILLVAITVVLAAVLYVLISGLTHGPGTTPIGSAFTAGNPSLTKQGATGTASCAAAHYCYTLTVESSTVTFGSVQFEVKNPAGNVVVLTGVGAFSVLNVTSTQVATQGSLSSAAMSGAFSSFPGNIVTTSTPLTNLYTIVVDMGTVNPGGQGYSFVTLGIGSFSGTTSVALP